MATLALRNRNVCEDFSNPSAETPMALVTRNREAKRRGLTLLELIVVLVLLIALAGIVIPLLPSMLGRSETASGATSQTETYKWIQTYEQLYFGYPRDWDALTDGTVKITYVRGGPDVVLDSGLTAEEADALSAAGITRLQLMVEAATGTTPPPPENKTFDPYQSPDFATNGLTPAAGTRLVVLTLSGQKALNQGDGITSTGKFVVFGFGKRASIVGKGVANAPVVFRDDGSKTPDKVYCRYGVVFQVANITGALERARFVGTCNFKGGGVFTSDDDLEEFYNLNQGGS